MPSMPLHDPSVPLGVIKSNIVIRAQSKKPKTFTTTCPHCLMKNSNMHPTMIVTNGSTAVPGGISIQRTITFECVNRGCLETFQSSNTSFMPESIAVEDEPSVGSSVLPDTTPPVVSIDSIASDIRAFTNKVNFSWNRSGWFGVVILFQTNSNSFYTVWNAPAVGSTQWQEFPTPNNLHPARTNTIYSLFLPPTNNGNLFYQVRSLDGGTRITWQ